MVQNYKKVAVSAGLSALVCSARAIWMFPQVMRILVPFILMKD